MLPVFDVEFRYQIARQCAVKSAAKVREEIATKHSLDRFERAISAAVRQNRAAFRTQS